jgi:hypothetical protein
LLALLAISSGAGRTLAGEITSGNGLGHGWFEADYLLWWTRGMDLPPLLTTSPAGTPFSDAGVLTNPDTVVLIGNEAFQDDARSGWRLGGGFWLDACGERAVDFDYLRIGSLGGENIPYGEDGAILGRPFVDATTGQPEAELITYPGIVAGLGNVQIGSSGLEGWGVGLRHCLAQCGDCCERERLDFRVGYRRYRVGDSLLIQERLRSPLFASGTVLVLDDEFAARNTFHGAELGLLYQRQRAKWQVQGRANVGLGVTHSEIAIDGQTMIVSPGAAPLRHTGGLYALSSNIGQYEADEFTTLFETGIDLSYRVTCKLSFDIGYTFLLWPGVYRSADQIDTTINPDLLPPPLTNDPDPARPRVALRDSTFWAQGIQVGVTYRY